MKSILLRGALNLCPVALAALGFGVLQMGGRPMLFGAMALWGLAVLVLLVNLSRLLPPKGQRIMLRSLAGLVLAGLALFGLLEVLVTAGSGTQISGEPEAMIVLGANLWGESPSPVLRQRLDTALEYLSEHPSLTVVVTGGMGDDEPITEADCMAAYLESHGIAPERILREEQATNTMENLRFSKMMLEERKISTENVIIVTNSAHLARVKMLAKRNHLTASALSAPVPGGMGYRCYFYLREGAAMVKSWLFDRL